MFLKYQLLSLVSTGFDYETKRVHIYKTILFSIFLKLKIVFMNIYSILPCGVAIILQLLRLVYLTEDEMQTLQQI